MQGLVCDRRRFLRFGLGVASFSVLSGLGLVSPKRADAIAGIDDAALGGLVLLVATLGGYALSRSVANVSLDALGYGFSDFCSDADNRASAVTKAIADANNLGIELNRSNAEQAASAISAGTGYFAEVMAGAVDSGRVVLDNFISGAGELPGVLRTLVGDYVGTRLGVNANLLPGCVGTDLASGFSFDSLSVNNQGVIAAQNFDSMVNGLDVGNAIWCIKGSYYDIRTGNFEGGNIVFGSQPIRLTANNEGRRLSIGITVSGDSFTVIGINTDGSQTVQQNITGVSIGRWPNTYKSDFTFSGNLVSGSALPSVDRATDAPDVIGPGYDSLPLANDLVIDPSTDEVTSAGSLPLPTSIPDVFGDYVGTLNDMLAGVVPNVIGLPVSVSEPVVVGTAEGVQTMSITDAISSATSLEGVVVPPAPTPPPGTIDPPVDVPEGPWTPAVTLPFEQLWPFNMIYSMIQVFDELGG